MSKIKFFIITLLVAIIVSVYWAYYISNIIVFDTENSVIPSEFLKSEKKLFEDYSDNNKVLTKSWLSKSSNIYNDIKILKTVPNDKINYILPNAEIRIIFSDLIKIESMLWYIPSSWGIVSCPWSDEKVSTSFWDLFRCDNLNKVFLYKKWKERIIFSWSAKRSVLNWNTIILIPSPSLDISSSYVLEIESWIEWISQVRWDPSMTKESIIIEFKTTWKDWDIISNLANTWVIISTWAWLEEVNLDNSQDSEIFDTSDSSIINSWWTIIDWVIIDWALETIYTSSWSVNEGSWDIIWEEIIVWTWATTLTWEIIWTWSTTWTWELLPVPNWGTLPVWDNLENTWSISSSTWDEITE